jgi:hypothetical protein
MVLAGVVFLLVVLPAMKGGASPSFAQPDELAEPGMPEGPEDPGMPPGAGEPGMPGGPPGMPGGGPDFGGAPMSGAAPDGPTEPSSSFKGAPIEPSPTQPFRPAPIAGGAFGDVPLERMQVTRYGSNWSQIPITQRMGFPDPEVPARKAPKPPSAVIDADKPLRVTSIMWTQDGQALAVYEFGEGPDKLSGVVRPGDVVENWRAVEIRGDHIVVEDRKSNVRTEVYLSEKAPEPKQPEIPQRRPGGRQPRGGR